MGRKAESQRNSAEFTALVIHTLLRHPNEYTAPELAAALGDGVRRTQRAMLDIRRAGWGVEYESRGKITLHVPRPQTELRDETKIPIGGHGCG